MNSVASTKSIGARAATDRIRMAVVIDDARARNALAFQLNTAGFEVASYSSADELLVEKAAVNIDCVVSDIFLPRMNGLQLQERLAETGNFVSIVFVTGRGDLAIAVHAMRAGAVDVLEKPVEEAALMAAIARGVQRSRRMRTEQTERHDLERRLQTLPARQRELFMLITAGLLNKEAAAKMGISERTVKVHRVRLRRKMGADSVAELSRMAAVLQIHAPGALSFLPKQLLSEWRRRPRRISSGAGAPTLLHRQRKGERTATARTGAEPDSAAVALDNRSGH